MSFKFPLTSPIRGFHITYHLKPTHDGHDLKIKGQKRRVCTSEPICLWFGPIVLDMAPNIIFLFLFLGFRVSIVLDLGF